MTRGSRHEQRSGSRTAAAAALAWLVFALGAVGCARAPAPFRFTLAGLPGTSIVDAITRVYEAEKLPTAKIHPSGVVESRWIFTGQAYGFLRDGTPTTLVKRFSTVVESRDKTLHVTLNVQLLRCGTSAQGDLERSSDCEPVVKITKAEQAEIDALGARLRAAVEKLR